MRSIIVRGYCPVLNQNWEIEQEYIEYQMDGRNGAVKGCKKCDFAKAYGACTIKCPLEEKAPNIV